MEIKGKQMKHINATNSLVKYQSINKPNNLSELNCVEAKPTSQ